MQQMHEPIFARPATLLFPSHFTSAMLPPAFTTSAARAPAHWLAVDSDGCVLDTMEPKHRQCFAPALIEAWGLAEIEPHASEEFLRLNLRSEHRGANRFFALHLFWRWLAERAPGDFFARTVPPLARLDAWVLRGGPLSEAALAAELARFPGDAALTCALRWSQLVNQHSRSLPPARAFTGAPEALAEAAAAGPLHVVSGGHGTAIREEWHGAGLHELASEFHTQEAGSKEVILRALVTRHPHGAGLMVGDGPGDADAAQAAGVLFFPIAPSREEESWRIFRREILPTFYADGYTAADSRDRTAAFRAALR